MSTTASADVVVRTIKVGDVELKLQDVLAALSDDQIASEATRRDLLGDPDLEGAEDWELVQECRARGILAAYNGSLVSELRRTITANDTLHLSVLLARMEAGTA